MLKAYCRDDYAAWSRLRPPGRADVHHAHVAVGLLLDLWLLGKLLRGLTNYRLVALRVIAVYWYFVAVAGVCVVLTQIYPSL